MEKLEQIKNIIALPFAKKIGKDINLKERKLIIELTQQFNNLDLTLLIVSLLEIWNNNKNQHTYFIDQLKKWKN